MLLKKISAGLEDKTIRILLSLIAGLFMAMQRQFTNQVLYWFALRAHSLLLGGGYNLMRKIRPFVPFNPANVWLYAKVMYFGLHFVLLICLVMFYFNKRSITLTALKLIAGWIVFGIVFNFTGKILHNATLIEGGRNLIELIMSPFSAAFLIPALLLQQKTERENLQRNAKKN